MNPQPGTPQPAQKPPRRRRCICGCRRLFVPAKPWQKFYEDQCRKQHHRYGGEFGTLKRDGVKRLVKEARAEIRSEFRELLTRAIEDVLHKNGWSDAKTKAIELSPLALKGGIDTLAALLRELRSDYVRLEARVKLLESGERQKLTDLERRVRFIETNVPVR